MHVHVTSSMRTYESAVLSIYNITAKSNNNYMYICYRFHAHFEIAL